MFETYKPSGRFGGMAIPMVLLGLVIAFAVAFVYHLTIHWIPLIYINFLVTFGLGILLGVVGSIIVKIGKIRNVPLALLIGLLLTLSSLAGKFYFQHQQMIKDSVAYVMEDPEAQGADPAEVEKVIRNELTFSEHIKTRVEQGWQLGRAGRGGGAPISGVFVYIVWLIEMVIVAWSAISMTRAAAQEPFSEKLNEWASEEEIVMELPVTSEEMVSQIKSATTVDQLLEIPIPKTDASDQFACYKVNSIEGQELEDAYLSVDLTKLYLDKDGNQQTDSTPLVQHAILSSDQRKQLIENAELLNEAMIDYREALHEDADAASDDADSLAEESGEDGGHQQEG